jgi:hypothetical protein
MTIKVQKVCEDTDNYRTYYRSKGKTKAWRFFVNVVTNKEDTRCTTDRPYWEPDTPIWSHVSFEIVKDFSPVNYYYTESLKKKYKLRTEYTINLYRADMFKITHIWSIDYTTGITWWQEYECMKILLEKWCISQEEYNQSKSSRQWPGFYSWYPLHSFTLNRIQ